MNPANVAILVFVLLCIAILIGHRLRRLVPADHLISDTRETLKLAAGLIGTMAALVVGLLVSSAKSS
jgi:hypothetical protein